MGVRISQLFYRRSIFPPNLEKDELVIRYELSRRLIKRWESATAKMEVCILAPARTRNHILMWQEVEYVLDYSSDWSMLLRGGASMTL